MGSKAVESWSPEVDDVVSDPGFEVDEEVDEEVVGPGYEVVAGSELWSDES
ncbi:MAG: hypothetical protein H0Z28_00495 [Archaeoglobus sp.]|nr:hypothetical protein [Archaeoglobus sp.]